MRICVHMERVHGGKQVLRLAYDVLQHKEEAVTEGQEKRFKKEQRALDLLVNPVCHI